MKTTSTSRDRVRAHGWAWCALLAAVGLVLALVALLLANVVTLVLVLVALGVAAALGWVALTRLGVVRSVAAGLAVAALVAGAVLMVVRGALDELVVLVAAGVVFTVATRRALWSSRYREPPPAPSLVNGSRSRAAAGRAVLLMNPRSGGGKVERFELVVEAERRGIEPVLLRPGDDLSALAREAARSAEVIGMAGGDGSQALVAQIAMEHGVEFVCVPAGTRNHLALDLGLDRGDVVGALDAFTSGTERVIDLAFVNERVFVNNVSLGIYAEIVQSEAYRDAKRETVQKMLPELLGPRAKPFDLRFAGPDGGGERSAQLLLVSNNPYVLDALVGSGSRPRMDTGRLGIVAVEIRGATEAAKLVSLEALRQVRRFAGLERVVGRSFPGRVRLCRGGRHRRGSGRPRAPLRFTITPAALRVRLPPYGGRALAGGAAAEAQRLVAPRVLEDRDHARLSVAATNATRPVPPPTTSGWRARLGSEQFFVHPERALLIGAALLALVGLTAALIPAEPLALERSWAEAMQDIPTPALERVALVFNWLGRGLGRTLSLAVIGVVLLVARRWLALLAFAATEALTPLLSTLLKAHVDRPRPPGGLIHPSGASFPSGHAAYAGATCVALVLLFTLPGPRRRLWWTIAAVGIVGMAWSRTYLQVHWLTDVTAGSLLGIGVTLVTFAATQRWAAESDKHARPSVRPALRRETSNRRRPDSA